MATTRRTVLANGAWLGTAAMMPGGVAAAATVRASKRPPSNERRFTSPAVEREIVRVGTRIADPELRWMFENCYPNTLDTTVKLGSVGGRPDAFVITGDIPCLWLRDSAAQVRPYLHLVPSDPKLGELFRGLIARQARSVLIDPYANAFMEDPAARTNLEWSQVDRTDMKPGVAERKWEIDSLCYALRLAHDYWTTTYDPRPFDAVWAQSAARIVQTFREQQRKTSPGPYRFQRSAPQPTETLLAGYGAPTRKIGLIHSGFRPSDDSCTFPFLIPSNLFAVKALRELAEVATEARRDTTLATDATALADEVERSLHAHGTMVLKDGRKVWAYEVDGFGNAIFMDDANVPSLSGLAFLGCVAPADPLWRTTRDAAWSDDNPWFFRGKAGEGIGGPHVGEGQIWPMSIIMRAFSATDDATIRQCLATLKATHGGTGFVHESFDKDDPKTFTRSWFAWANGLFGQLIVHLADTRPHLLR